MGIKLFTKKNFGGFMITFILIFVLGFGIVFIANKTERQSERNAFTSIERTASQISKDYSEHIDNDTLRLKTMADIMANMMATNPKCTADDIKGLFKGFSNCEYMSDVDILLSDGTFVSLNDKEIVGEKPDFNEEKTKDGHMTDLQKSFNGDGDALYNVVPVKKGDTIYGILYSKMALDDMARLLKDIHAESLGESYIMDIKTEELIVANGKKNTDIGILRSGSNGNYYINDSVEADFALGKSGNVRTYSGVDNDYSYSFYTPIENTNFMLILRVTETEMLSEAKSITTPLNWLLVLFSLLLILYFMWLLWSSALSARRSKVIHDVERALMEGYNDKEYITGGMRTFCKFKDANAVFYITMNNDKPVNIYEWASDPRYAAEKEDLKEFFMKPRLKSSTVNRSGIIKRSKALRETEPKITAYLDKTNANSVSYTVVTDIKGNAAGVMCVVDPKTEKNNLSVQEELAYGFSMAIKNYEYFSEMEKAGTEDPLTGMLNRHSYHDALLNRRDELLDNLTCVYVDANGLHDLNNTKGHEAGDKMLVSISQILIRNFGKQCCFRIGGDEFTAILENIQQDTIEHIVKRIFYEVDKLGYSVSIGYQWCDSDINVDRIMKEAEKEMYRCKYEYYKEHGRKAR